MGYGASACPRCGLIQSGVVSAVEANDKLTELKAERDALAEALRRIKRYHPDAPVLEILPIVRAALDKLGEDE